MTTIESLQAQITEIEAQIQGVKAQVEELRGEPRPVVRSFGELRGLFRDASDTTPEMLDEAEYRVPDGHFE